MVLRYAVIKLLFQGVYVVTWSKELMRAIWELLNQVQAREVMWWPGMSSQLETVVVNYDVCAQYRREQRKEPLQASTLPERPWPGA
jgi:hypothetical protein